jgi:hypothetical protein
MAGRVGPQSLRRLIEQAAVLRVLDVREVDRILVRGRRRGAPNLRALLEVPECNVKLRIDGEPLEIDLLWKEQRLAIETDGEETHGTRSAFQSDRRRDQLSTSPPQDSPGSVGVDSAENRRGSLEQIPSTPVATSLLMRRGSSTVQAISSTRARSVMRARRVLTSGW